MAVALVVADGEWVVDEVRSALTLGEWEVETMSDPRAVRERLEESRVDAVIADLQVGSKGGMAIIRAVRDTTDPITRPRMVMLLDRTADEFLVRRAGADAAVVKPVNATALRAALGMVPVGVGAGADEEE